MKKWIIICIPLIGCAVFFTNTYMLNQNDEKLDSPFAYSQVDQNNIVADSESSIPNARDPFDWSSEEKPVVKEKRDRDDDDWEDRGVWWGWPRWWGHDEDEHHGHGDHKGDHRKDHNKGHGGNHGKGGGHGHGGNHGKGGSHGGGHGRGGGRGHVTEQN